MSTVVQRTEYPLKDKANLHSSTTSKAPTIKTAATVSTVVQTTEYPLTKYPLLELVLNQGSMLHDSTLSRLTNPRTIELSLDPNPADLELEDGCRRNC